MSYGGQANLTWSTDSAATPSFYDITFEITDSASVGFGDMVACAACDESIGGGKVSSDLVTEAIQVLGGAGRWSDYYPPLQVGGGRAWRVFQRSACYWASPYFEIHEYPGWWVRVQLTQSTNGDDADDTDWELQVALTRMDHVRTNQNLGPCFCDEDMTLHRFFRGIVTQAQYNCDDPPLITNTEYTCDGHDPHINLPPGSDEPDDFYPCGTGGRATLVPETA